MSAHSPGLATSLRKRRSSRKTPPPNRLPPIHPCPRRIGTLGAPTSSSAHGSALPAEDRYPGCADVLVGTRFSPYALRKPGWTRASTRSCATQEKNAGKMPALRAAKAWVAQGSLGRPPIAMCLRVRCRGGPLWPPIGIAPHVRPSSRVHLDTAHAPPVPRLVSPAGGGGREAAGGGQ